jgi:uncharacterized membrane protein YccC
VLWTLMPIAIFAAAYVPRVASFTAGQAVLTMMVMIAYNLIVPTGWRAGLLRIEDVGAGAVVAVIAAGLLWPRGATASGMRVGHARAVDGCSTNCAGINGRPPCGRVC